MSKLTKALDVISECDKELQKLSSNKRIAEKKIENIVSNPVIKKFIINKLLENMSDDYKKKVTQKREKIKYDNEHHIFAIECNDIFDPEHDNWIIDSYNVNDNKIVFSVECVSMREHLGITGSWIPHYFKTVPINKDELEKMENGQNETLQ